MKLTKKNIVGVIIVIVITLIITFIIYSKNNKNIRINKNIKNNLDNLKQIKQNIFLKQQKEIENKLKEIKLNKNRKKNNKKYPKIIKYTYITYNYITHQKIIKQKKIQINKKPKKIVSHSVCISEILWAIAPHENLIGFNKICTNPNYCFIANEIKNTGKIFSNQETEKIILWKPDLVFVESYSSNEFVSLLKKAKIKIIQLGIIENIDTLIERIKIIGKCIGEEEKSQELIKRVLYYANQIKKKFKIAIKPRVLSYSIYKTVAGKNSTFDYICNILNIKNAAQEIYYFKEVSKEWILKQNPDIIIVDSKDLKERFHNDRLLRYLKAVKNNKIIYINKLYLYTNSQFLIASANKIAGEIYKLYKK